MKSLENHKKCTKKATPPKKLEKLKKHAQKCEKKCASHSPRVAEHSSHR